MAVTLEFVCKECKKDSSKMLSFSERQNVISYGGTCNACEGKARQLARKNQLADWAKGTTEKRLARIEKFMYDHGQVTHGYQQPPRMG